MARPKVLGDVKRIMVSLPLKLAEAVDDYRFKNRLKSDAAVLRRLIELGLGKAPTSAPLGGSAPRSTRKPAATAKPAPRAKKPGKSTSAPKAKALPMSKEAQIRALREQRVDEV